MFPAKWPTSFLLSFAATPLFCGYLVFPVHFSLQPVFEGNRTKQKWQKAPYAVKINFLKGWKTVAQKAFTPVWYPPTQPALKNRPDTSGQSSLLKAFPLITAACRPFIKRLFYAFPLAGFGARLKSKVPAFKRHAPVPALRSDNIFCFYRNLW